MSLDTGWGLFPILLLGLAFLFGVELTAEVIEMPFGLDGDHLPLDGLCATMEKFVLESAELRRQQPLPDSLPERGAAPASGSD